MASQKWNKTTDDQKFLVLFILGTYFGPDLKGRKSIKSALQRRAEGLPQYTSENLAKTEMKTCYTERVYYHVLRMANPAVLLKLPLLRQFVKGNLFTVTDGQPIDQYRQFTDIFPTDLHPQSQFRDRYKTLANIVFISDPDISYIKPEDIERFKSLTGLDNLVLDRFAAITAKVGAGTIPPTIPAPPAPPAEASRSSTSRVRSSRRSQKRKRVNHDDCREDQAPPNSVSSNIVAAPPPNEVEEIRRVDTALVLHTENNPTTDPWSNIIVTSSNGTQLVGTAAARQAGPLVGMVDFGVSDDAYLFRVSMPGVRRNANDLSCKVQANGRVVIEGVTETGQRYVTRNNQVFRMRTRNFCPPGPFRISFKLPGPVQASELIANYRRGILEGIVKKA